MVELDFLYPSEGIHKRWDGGYRITATAATNDQSALILSIPRPRPSDETQETLRTSQFPSTHVKVREGEGLRDFLKLILRLVLILSSSCVQEKWSKNLYLACLCYGRTVCWFPSRSSSFYWQKKNYGLSAVRSDNIFL